MFDRILIANRGEIACRIVDTCRRLGVGTVAVHSDVDARARHVAMADLAVSLGGATPAESYLRGEAVIAAALETGAGAIHPGYGFLSENPDFVEMVGAAGLVFIGPSAAAIRKMGLKDAAKALMEEAGVPVVPGYRGHDQADTRLAREAAAIGWPVMIKAVAGGGGKGMRLVAREADFADALAGARSEARGAFGNDAVLIEKAIAAPRHVEVQIFGDGVRAVHLYERDCSLQRRHQKVIEEAPAPGMTEEMRAAMGRAAVRAAEAIGYAGAGTVEFIVDATQGLRPDRFWFMEMNTRLQVEHPVTEAVTGVDLVEWQLRVAAGEGLPAVQEDLALDGHAVEARLYAEDVPAGFLPATGVLAHLRFPSDLRVERGVRKGDEITPHYDPMIAKLIAHGPTRSAALGRLSAGLERVEIAGTVTNLGFLRALMGHESVRRGDVDTGLIGREIDRLAGGDAPPDHAVAMAALAAMGLDRPGDNLQGFALWRASWQRVRLVREDAEIEAAVRVTGADAREVRVGDEEAMDARWVDGRWRIGGAMLSPAIRHGGAVTVMSGPVHRFGIVDPLARDAPAGAGGNLVLAPMPGLVRSIGVSQGERVEAGAALAVLEAMKMEHVLRAGRDGSVAEVMAAPGDQVSAGAALIRLEDEDPD